MNTIIYVLHDFYLTARILLARIVNVKIVYAFVMGRKQNVIQFEKEVI